MSQTPLAPPNALLNARQKKLLFRAWHRGTREADLLVGRFGEAAIPHFSESDMDLFEELLDENDPDIFDWVTGKAALPVLPIQPLLMQMMEFYKAGA